MNDAQARKLAENALQEVVGEQAGAISWDSPAERMLRDIGLTSLALYELVSVLEDLGALQFRDEDVDSENFVTLASLRDLLARYPLGDYAQQASVRGRGAVFVGLGARERALVLGCVQRDSADESLRELAVEDLSWNAILMASLWHKVAFLVYRRLARASALDPALTEGNLPLLLLNHWKQLVKVNELRSHLYADAARAVCAAAGECGADLAVAKGGPLLFGAVYTPAERKTYDVDFLARRSELELVESALRRAGFRYGEYRHGSEELLGAREGDRRKHLLQGRGLPNFLLKPESAVIDYLVAQVRFRVGASTAAGASVPAERLLEHAEDRDGMRAVCWIDLALQLALHLHREAHETEYQRWNLHWNLIKLCDFDRVMHLPQLSVAAVAGRADELGFTRELGFAAHVTDLMLPSRRFTELGERCGEITHRQAERYDRGAVERLVWSVGTALNRQASPWTTIVGAKTS